MPQATVSISLPRGTPLCEVGSRSGATLHVVGASLASSPPALPVSCPGSDAADATKRLRDHEAFSEAELPVSTTDEALSAVRRTHETSTVDFDVRSVHAGVASSRP